MWSAPVTTVPPAAEPLLLPAVKEFLRIDADDATFDTELGGYLLSVRDDAEAISATRLITQTVELRADCFADLLHLPIGPVQSIASLTYIDGAGDEQILDPETDFELFGAGLETGLRPVFGSTWPAGAMRASSIVVTAVLGYGDAAADLPQAVYVALLRSVRGLFDDKGVDLASLLANHRIWL
jgi:uncharacterized phiE125 gp8 family phage protein